MSLFLKYSDYLFFLVEIIKLSEAPEYFETLDLLSFDIVSTENGPLILLLSKDFVSSSYTMKVLVELKFCYYS